MVQWGGGAWGIVRLWGERGREEGWTGQLRGPGKVRDCVCVGGGEGLWVLG